MQRTLQFSSAAIPDFLGKPALEAVKIKGVEGVDALFSYALTLKTPDGLNYLAADAANFKLNDFIGRELTVHIALEGSGTSVSGAMGALAGNTGAGVREITGIITAAEFLREEGRHALYGLTLKPWLYLATLRSDCRIFQDQTVVDVLDAVLSRYDFPVEKRLVETYPVRDYTVQYNETDFEFFERLCQTWGISYFFSHADGKHRLVLIDNMGAYQKTPSSAYHTVSFYPKGHKIDEEYLHAFVPTHGLTSGAYATNDYSYTRPKADVSASRSDPRDTAHNDYERFAWHAPDSSGAHYVQPKAGANQAENDPNAEGDAVALLRMQALRSKGHRAHAQGHLRGMVAGCVFNLAHYPQDAANTEYLILRAELECENVAQESQIIDGGRAQQYTVQVDVHLHPTRGETYRPALTRQKPRIGGVQNAVVVGSDGQNIWTDALGRIKVHFLWNRYSPKNENSSCWVRVSSAWAGNQLGGMHLPRIGQEVLISFVNGNIDLPVCTGRVYNADNMPPWQLPEQQALSGFRSRELTDGGGNAASGRSNHLVLDDTKDSIQAQLKSDHAHSQLSLGHITRIEDNAGRKDARGEGFELRSDAWGSVRAQKGLLLSTEGRPNAAAHITDMGETVARLQHSHSQQQSSVEAAKAYQTQDGEATADETVEALKDQLDGVKGKEEKETKEFAEPHVVIASPAGIASTTPHTTHLHAGEHIALTSGAHTSLSVGKSLLATVGGGIRLFSHALGIKLVAVNNDITLHALKENIHLLAKLNIRYKADSIELTAKKKVTVNGGGSYTTWAAGGIEDGTKGSWKNHAAGHGMPGAKSKGAQLPTKKLGKGNLELLHTYNHAQDVVKQGEYTVIDAMGKKVSGMLDDKGFALVSGLAAGPVSVLFKPDSRDPWDEASQFKMPAVQPKDAGLLEAATENDITKAMGAAASGALLSQAAGLVPSLKAAQNALTLARALPTAGAKDLFAQSNPSILSKKI